RVKSGSGTANLQPRGTRSSEESAAGASRGGPSSALVIARGDPSRTTLHGPRPAGVSERKDRPLTHDTRPLALALASAESELSQTAQVRRQEAPTNRTTPAAVRAA